MKLLIDTNAISRLFAGDKQIAAALAQADTVFLSVFVLGELLTGLYGGKKEKENLAYLRNFLHKPTVKLLTADAETADYFARLKNRLAAMGKPIPINDVWIAAHALQSASSLLTFDAHFNHIIGLRLYSLS